MKPSEKFTCAIEGRKAGRSCQVEHPSWSPMDDLTVKHFIPDGLRKVYWLNHSHKADKAYVAARELWPRINYEPWLWRLPESIRVSQTDSVPTVDLLRMAEKSAASLPFSVSV